MQFINIHDVKTHLSKYLQQIVTSHQPIVICKNGKPIAQLVEYKKKGLRKAGALKGKIKTLSNLWNILNEFSIGQLY